jgi:hypothetical protein
MIKKQIAAIVLALWLTIISVFMLFAERIDIIQFYILALIGTLVIVEYIEPYYVQPGYLRYIRFLIVVGILIFIVIVGDILMEILGLEIVL